VKDPPGKNRFTCSSVVFPTGNTSARTLSNERGPSLGGGASGAYRASGGLAIATMCPLTRCVGSAQQPNGRFNLFSLFRDLVAKCALPLLVTKRSSQEST